MTKPSNPSNELTQLAESICGQLHWLFWGFVDDLIAARLLYNELLNQLLHFKNCSAGELRNSIPPRLQVLKIAALIVAPSVAAKRARRPASTWTPELDLASQAEHGTEEFLQQMKWLRQLASQCPRQALAGHLLVCFKLKPKDMASVMDIRPNSAKKLSRKIKVFFARKRAEEHQDGN